MKKFYKNYDSGEQGKVQFLMLLLSFAKQAADTMGDEALKKYNVPIAKGLVLHQPSLPPIRKYLYEMAYVKMENVFGMNEDDNSKYR